jgi:hypothetical protein
MTFDTTLVAGALDDDLTIRVRPAAPVLALVDTILALVIAILNRRESGD